MNALMPHGQADMGGKPTIGARTFTLFLAVGVYISIVGIVFLSPFALNSTAIQNDVYMTNLFLAPAIIALGVLCLLVGGIGMWREVHAGRASRIGRRPLIIAALGAVVMVAFYLVFGGHYSDAYGVISWPPYMNLASLILAPIVGVLVLVAVWFWGAEVQREA